MTTDPGLLESPLRRSPKELEVLKDFNPQMIFFQWGQCAGIYSVDGIDDQAICLWDELNGDFIKWFLCAQAKHREKFIQKYLKERENSSSPELYPCDCDMENSCPTMDQVHLHTVARIVLELVSTARNSAERTDSLNAINNQFNQLFPHCAPKKPFVNNYIIHKLRISGHEFRTSYLWGILDTMGQKSLSRCLNKHIVYAPDLIEH